MRAECRRIRTGRLVRMAGYRAVEKARRRLFSQLPDGKQKVDAGLADVSSSRHITEVTDAVINRGERVNHGASER